MCTLLRKFINCFKKRTTPSKNKPKKPTHNTRQQPVIPIARLPIQCTPKIQHNQEYKFYCNTCTKRCISTYYFHAVSGICPTCDKFRKHYPLEDYHSNLEYNGLLVTFIQQTEEVEEALEDSIEDACIEEAEYDY